LKVSPQYSNARRIRRKVPPTKAIVKVGNPNIISKYFVVC